MGILSGQAMTDADYRQQEVNEQEEMELIEQMDAAGFADAALFLAWQLGYSTDLPEAE